MNLKGTKFQLKVWNYLKGTKFQLKVWNYLKKIPKGKVKTYLEVAKAIGKPKAFRAVANAVGKNPYPPKIPLSSSDQIRWKTRRILWKRWNSTKTTFIEIRKDLHKIVLLTTKMSKTLGIKRFLGI